MLDPDIAVDIAVEASKKLRQLENEVSKSWDRKLRLSTYIPSAPVAYLTMGR